MKKISEKPELFLLIVGVILLGASLFISAVSVNTPETARVYYVSNSEKQALIALGDAEDLKININTADPKELERLNGIGEVLSARIVEYREAHGDFSSVEELLNIDGVGEKLLEKLTPYLICE